MTLQCVPAPQFAKILLAARFVARFFTEANVRLQNKELLRLPHYFCNFRIEQTSIESQTTMHHPFRPFRVLLCFLVLSCLLLSASYAQDSVFSADDIFQLEYGSDPRISPDGAHIAFVRNSMDIMNDRARPVIWVMNSDGTDARPVSEAGQDASAPRWSPDGTRLLFTARSENNRQVFVRWMDSGQTAQLTNLTQSAGNFTWSPDGSMIAFTAFVEKKPTSLISMPAKPEGASWAKPALVIDRIPYRGDGRGYLPHGFTHLFVLPAEGGSPRQLTTGDFNHSGTPAWTPDSEYILISSNRSEDTMASPRNTDIVEVAVKTGNLRALTSRLGPDNNPTVSPDGRHIAFTGFDDLYQGYQVAHLYVMRRDGSAPEVVIPSLDRDIVNPQWSADGDALFFQYDDQGNTKIARTNLSGEMEILADHVGGLSLGRPYSGGQYSVSHNGRIAFTLGDTSQPADIATATNRSDAQRLTHLNSDVLAQRNMGAVEEIWYPSSFDDRQIQGWIVKPPNFDPAKKYPLILEIHGGPFSNYGDRFSAEVQLFAAAGYVVLYTNPRGSTSYGAEFGNLIHHNYPGEDYDDLISGVDAVIEKGYIDPERLYVTGGSGGGVLTSWIIGKTDRFKAAVVAKPVINWYSFVLNADNNTVYYKYWFPGLPWEHESHYMKRSPISLVGNVTTPTMLLTGEADLRTPISETEQYYAALKLQGVESVMVRIPDATHGIASRPSNLIAKVAYILKWFEMYP